jgi:hypothetical protein
LNFKPIDANDYFGVGGWLVSRNLVKCIVILVGLIGLYYFLFVSPINILNPSDKGVRVYKYSSVTLRFVKGNVMIKDRQKNVAYSGYVSKGMANGTGILYYEGPDKDKLYEGEFKDNKYSGNGTLYYQSGLVKYSGEFLDNEESGNGTSYRENGSKEFSGEFKNGYPEGENEYYDSSNNLVYTGMYSKGNLVYTEILGKNSTDIADMYTGHRTVYYDDTNYMVVLDDINAMYCGDTDQNPIEDSISATTVYVIKSECYIKGDLCTTIAQISDEDKFGECVYEGNSYIEVPEMVISSHFNLELDCELTAENSINDVYGITDSSSDQLVYIYAFENEGILYSFYCYDKNEGFFMYSMQKEL